MVNDLSLPPPLPLTIGELADAGGRLAIHCAGCGRFRYMNAGRYQAADVVADLGRTLHCMRCLSRDVEARCILPHPVSGRWPAEGS